MPIENDKFVIRVSSLSDFADCEWRFMVRNDYELKAACKAERETTNKVKPAHIGAIFGTAAHSGHQKMLEDKMNLGSYSVRTATDAAIAKFRAQIEDLKEKEIPRKTDDFTKNDQIAEKQLARCMQEFAAAFVITSKPLFIEGALEMPWGSDFLLRGHPDLVELIKTVDFKYGARKQWHGLQGGGYLWLVRKILNLKSEYFELNHIKRTGIGNPQAFMTTKRLEAEMCMRRTAQVVNALTRKVDRFYTVAKRDLIFIRNGNSKLCHQSTCPAWGTTQCDQWADDVGKENETSGY